MAEVSLDVHKDSAFDVQIWINVVKITKTVPGRFIDLSGTFRFFFDLNLSRCPTVSRESLRDTIDVGRRERESQVSEELKPKSVF